MKKILSVVLFLTTLLCLQPAWAESQTLSLEGLSAEQIQQVQEKVNSVREEASPELSQMSKAVEVGRMLGAGLVATAKELGVAVNDFAKTDVGRGVAVVLLWKYVGSDAAGLLFGSLILISFVGLGLTLIFRGFRPSVTEEYSVVAVFGGLFVRRALVKRTVHNSEVMSDSQDTRVLSGGVLCFIGLLVGLNCIF